MSGLRGEAVIDEVGETTGTGPEAVPVDVRIVTTSRGRRVRNHLATAAMGLAVLVAVIPLVAVIYAVFSKGGHLVNTKFLTSDIPIDLNRAASASKFSKFSKPGTVAAAPEQIVLGMGPAIVGTLIITGFASLLAIPLGVLGAVYLNEYGKANRLARFIRFMTDVMTGVPSVMMGVFIYTVWVLNFGVDGRSGFAGALALACLMLPIVIRSSEEMLRLVPNALREASAALGTRTWRTTISVVLPAALPGITSGAMLAVARAAGETAPLLFTIGAVSSPNFALTGSNTTLSVQIYNWATSGVSQGEQLAWGAAFTLIVIVVVLTLLARLVASRFTVR